MRYRIDGVLRQTMVLPRAAGIPLVSRIKIMSGLDIADRLRPQDGRARVAVNGVPVDLRVSTLPASHGEKVVVRILDTRATVLSLDANGTSARRAGAHQGTASDARGRDPRDRTDRLGEDDDAVLGAPADPDAGRQHRHRRGSGRISVAGHRAGAGSREGGADVRRRACARSFDRTRTSCSSARSATARRRRTAVQASLTGHLVLSTLHTIDAASSITRLTDIGVESYKLAAALKGIVAQRLLRRICPQVP